MLYMKKQKHRFTPMMFDVIISQKELPKVTGREMAKNFLQYGSVDRLA